MKFTHYLKKIKFLDNIHPFSISFLIFFIISLFLIVNDYRGTSNSHLLENGHFLLHSSITLLIIVLFLYWRKHSLSLKELQQAKLEVDRQRNQAKSILSSMSDAVIVINNQGIVQFLNPSSEILIGYDNNEAIDLHLNDVLTLFKDNQGVNIDTHQFLKDYLLQDNTFDLRVNHPDSDVIVTIKVSSINFQEKESGLVIVLRDVSTEHQLTDKLTYQLNHDNLTGLYNRVAFENQLEVMLEYTQINKNTHTALYLDLDRFKLVNDTGGHAAGDKLLTIISGLLASELRENDFLARLGGDEFGILLWNMSYQTAVDIAYRILTKVQDFRFEWESKAFDVGISIGLAMIDEDMKTLQDVMLAIDLACLQAKESGRNAVFIYEKDDQSLKHQKEAMNWLPRINKALKNDHFLLFFQSITPTPSHATLTPLREILIRMKDEDGTIISPALFITPAERYGVMKKIDVWVIEHTIAYLSQHKNGNFKGRYTINLSGQSLTDPDLPDRIESLLLDNDLIAEKLCFEITETAAIDNLSVAKTFVERMHNIGCGILLDDFGSGFSSFSYLKALPFDYIKIDGQFVHNISHDAVDEVMVRMIHEIAQVMDVKTIAEYVEDQQTLESLDQIGIDYIQGFLIAKPCPLIAQYK
ncbi:MAG: EAL domain-containing protein [Gammaproteobacteria bacterium]|nr:EAL domain-containing protein [Gammaproteobacteria bacterium]